VARRAAAINTQRGRDADLLLVSTGDFSGDPGIVEMYRSRFLARTMVEMGYGAVAVGERDLNYGVRTLMEEAENGLPVICANLYESGRRVFPPHVIRRIRGAKVGVIALLGETPREIDGLELRDPALEGREELRRLRGECDCVILLAHMERQKLLEILPSLAGVDVVLRGHAGEEEKERSSCADTFLTIREHAGLPVFFSGNRGRNLGLVELAGSRRARPSVVDSALIHLGGTVADDSVTAEKVKAYRIEESVKQRELQLSKLLARDAATGRLVERYLGIEICRRCHAGLMPRFVASRHFRAFETIRSRNDEANPECLPCHTTGYGRPTGYSPEAERKGAAYLQGVQCEACHGAGTLHARDGSYVKAARESCRACHTSKWSPEFDFETFWKRAGHPMRADSV
jgi:hypothetical protein